MNIQESKSTEDSFILLRYSSPWRQKSTKYELSSLDEEIEAENR